MLLMIWIIIFFWPNSVSTPWSYFLTFRTLLIFFNYHHQCYVDLFFWFCEFTCYLLSCPLLDHSWAFMWRNIVDLTVFSILVFARVYSWGPPWSVVSGCMAFLCCDVWLSNGATLDAPKFLPACWFLVVLPTKGYMFPTMEAICFMELWLVDAWTHKPLAPYWNTWVIPNRIDERGIHVIGFCKM